jgi:hypothetical protein
MRQLRQEDERREPEDDDEPGHRNRLSMSTRIESAATPIACGT